MRNTSSPSSSDMMSCRTNALGSQLIGSTHVPSFDSLCIAGRCFSPSHPGNRFESNASCSNSNWSRRCRLRHVSRVRPKKPPSSDSFHRKEEDNTNRRENNAPMLFFCPTTRMPFSSHCLLLGCCHRRRRRRRRRIISFGFLCRERYIIWMRLRPVLSIPKYNTLNTRLLGMLCSLRYHIERM